MRKQNSERLALNYTDFADQRSSLSKTEYDLFIERQQVNGIYTGFRGLQFGDGKSDLGDYDPSVNPVKHIMHHIL